ncbi:pol ii transcription elongation factor [Moniliophthora roreri]|uniref:RNA polymerase II-associated protein n=1 Tax=Moniliophthora roreri TaxID=221103 RepID=A0A0W0G4I3_MONRR|nr:pol ii transcription elongation factor [Moniliophthora roreri]
MEEEFGSPGRTIDIELGGQEVITIDLDNLDPDPQDVLDLLRDGQCTVWVWTKLASEYWRRGYVESAKRIGDAALESFGIQHENNDNLQPLLLLRANLQIALARRAPKVILPGAREDILPSDQLTKEKYSHEAATATNAALALTQASLSNSSSQLAFLTRGILQLDTRSFDEALRSFDQVLSEKPTNIVALLGKARILYARRSYGPALQMFQLVLRYSPNCQPDPRIGIGLCLLAMGNPEKAKAAWDRSYEVNPNEWAAQLLLGLEAINASKDASQSEATRAQLFLQGTKFVESAFRANQKNASAANALCELFIQKGQHKRALKLAERTIQFADTLTVLTEGHIRAARINHSEGNLTAATKHYTTASETLQKHPIAGIGLAGMQVLNDEMAGAIHTLDTLISTSQPKGPSQSTEPPTPALAFLASLRAYPRAGVSSSDVDKERAKARELFDRVTKSLSLTTSSPNSNALANDMAMYIEIAKLHQQISLEKTGKALREALRISSAGNSEARVEVGILNNLGVLAHLDDKYAEARGFYERALTNIASGTGESKGDVATSILYNLARVYEEEGEGTLAKEAYDKLLARHPEYVEAKIRLAHLLLSHNLSTQAHELVKQALTSESGNLNIRAYYTYFLIQSNLPKLAKDFVFATLKEHDKYDVYSLCAAGWIMYTQARELRGGSEVHEERRRGFQRSAEFYDKALQLDPCCAFAAQGLAIVTAEDSLGTGLVAGPGGQEEVSRRMKNAREALDVFAKVRESFHDGSVYMNMGHCYYARDEFDRAIESYETASIRFYRNQNTSVLLCLCRSWYAKAMKDQSYVAICTALQYAQKALHIQPSDKAVLYNIAMIQQKCAEMLFSLPPGKRKLEDLKWVIERAGNAQKLFASLASDKASIVPYSRDIADQRRKYGDNMLRKAAEHLATQTQFEDEVKARQDAARAKRQEERERQEQAEREKMEQLRIEAEKLAEERKKAREQALEWTREVRMGDSDDEKEKERKSRRSRKVRSETTSAAVSDEDEVPKKKRKGKLRKATGEEVADMDESPAMFTDDEDGEKPTKKRPKKRVVRDEDEEESSAPQRKKQYKSKEVLSDTDDEDMDG